MEPKTWKQLARIIMDARIRLSDIRRDTKDLRTSSELDDVIKRLVVRTCDEHNS